MKKLVYLEKDLEELFTDLHASGLWKDGKEISDAISYESPDKILKTYRKLKVQPNFDLKEFYNEYFLKLAPNDSNYQSDTSKPVEDHIEKLWAVLQRTPEVEDFYSTRIPLPHPYIVPGGRFNEIYYWDSYFTMLGLAESGKVEMIEHMVDNFSWMLNEIGFIPNGNRTYYLGRSQPPFFSLMVDLLAKIKGQETLENYAGALEKEYSFWMEGANQLHQTKRAHKRTLWLGEGEILNRYFDNISSPRAEMYQDDIALIEKKGAEGQTTLLNIRAACESGWDFSSRWCKVPNDLGTIRTTELIPVDLNCLLYHLELMISKANELKGDEPRASSFENKANARKAAILKYCWNETTQCFSDFDWINSECTASINAAMVYPMYFKIATKAQAEACAKTLETALLADGGLLTTNIASGQQWDAPNGWAPLQWMAIQGLRNYGLNELANTIKTRWVALNKKVFQNTGKLMEKYNVTDTSLLSGGGEYPVQDGFGWTNGVLLKLLSE
ncbi:alpha,alpha-trehalase TreF [Roseivirga pacifica]|uniref:alpha,alpha-trehalase TreF n=1 Tax=Roseivirga pacifica TaxID=1267423 RepID=UPI003BAE5FF3